MGSPLGPVLANIFMCHFEEKWVLNHIGRPSMWFRYVDDAFTLFGSKSNALQFLQYFNSCHVNIKFTIEFEENDVIRFLMYLSNVKIILFQHQFIARKLSLIFTLNGTRSLIENTK